MKVAINNQIGRKHIRFQITHKSLDFGRRKVSRVSLQDKPATGCFGLAMSALYICSSGLDKALRYRMEGELGLKFLLVLTDSILKGLNDITAFQRHSLTGFFN